MLAYWFVGKLHLKTQVLANGRILLIAYDRFERETLRIEVQGTQHDIHVEDILQNLPTD